MNDERAIVARLGESGELEHRYGHDPDLEGFETISFGGAPAHLVLTLDARDPVMEQLSLRIFPRLRFAFPFRYDNEEVSYTQDQGRIIFRDHPRRAGPDWPYAGCPARFARVPVMLCSVPRFIERERPLLARDHADDPDRTIYLGEHQTTTQEHDVTCPACRKPARLIARVPNQPENAEEETWGESYVFALFWFCDPCGVTITRNECD